MKLTGGDKMNDDYKLADVEISYNYDETIGRVIVDGHYFSNVTTVKVDYKGGELPIVTLEFPCDRLKLSGKVKLETVIKDGENNESRD